MAKGEPAISGAQQIGATRELKASEQNRSRGWVNLLVCQQPCAPLPASLEPVNTHHCHRLSYAASAFLLFHCRSASLPSALSSSSSSSHFVSFSLSIPEDIYPPPRITNETRDKENQTIRIRKEPVISSQSSSSSLNIRMNGLAHPPNPLPRKRRKLDTV